MLKRERQAFILHQVNVHNKVLSSTLSQEINVSEDTIRRDLQELALEQEAEVAQPLIFAVQVSLASTSCATGSSSPATSCAAAAGASAW